MPAGCAAGSLLAASGPRLFSTSYSTESSPPVTCRSAQRKQETGSLLTNAIFLNFAPLKMHSNSNLHVLLPCGALEARQRSLHLVGLHVGRQSCHFMGGELLLQIRDQVGHSLLFWRRRLTRRLLLLRLLLLRLLRCPLWCRGGRSRCRRGSSGSLNTTHFQILGNASGRLP